MDSLAVAASSRATYGASLAPDGSALAYIVDDDGYTRGVQRTLNGTQASTPRDVVLPVDGPISAMTYSPDGHFLACQVAPHSASHTQVWVVTSDPTDGRAWRVDGLDAESAELIGWDGDDVLITVERSDGCGESRRVDPARGDITVLDTRPEARLLDASHGVSVIRTGPRSDRRAQVLFEGHDVAIFDNDAGSVTDSAVILDIHKSLNLLHINDIQSQDSLPHSTVSATRSSVRILLRSDAGAQFARLVIATVTASGVETRVLAERSGSELDAFAVSYDETCAVLIWNIEGGRTDVQMINLCDASLQPPLRMPAGIVSEPHLDAEGRLLTFTLQSPRHERSVHIMDLRTGHCTAVDPAPFDSRAVDPELVHFTARDGLALSGWLYQAPTKSTARPGPIVIHLHGGPEGQERPGYSPTYPTLLAAGISVFAPNVRGSGGFGRHFVHADDRDLRMGSINDVADAASYLVTTGLADAAKIAIAGWSYGGYLTMATLAFHPKLACCGIAVSGMSDLRTFHATTEPWISRASRSKYGTPGVDDNIMAAVAPLLHADAVTAPLLAIHGGNDTNVPPTESAQMVDAVNAHGGSAELVILEGEGHEFPRHASRDRIAQLICDAVLAATS